MAILTDKPTLRTQVSFHAGIAELGGNPMLVDGNLAQVGVRETIADVTRVLSRHVAAIAWRTGAQARIEEMAAYASVPVVNALTDDYHPCQILACLQTITEHKVTAPDSPSATSVTGRTTWRTPTHWGGWSPPGCTSASAPRPASTPRAGHPRPCPPDR